MSFSVMMRIVEHDADNNDAVLHYAVLENGHMKVALDYEESNLDYLVPDIEVLQQQVNGCIANDKLSIPDAFWAVMNSNYVIHTK